MASTDSLSPASKTVAQPGSVISIRGTFDPSALAALPACVDRAAAIIAEQPMAEHLRRVGVRVPIFDEHENPETVEAVAMKYRLDAVPEIVDGVLVAGASHRRWAQLGPTRLCDIDQRVSTALERLEGDHAEYGHAHARRFAQTLERLRSPDGPSATLLELSSFPVITEIADEIGFWCAATVRDGGDAIARPSNPFDAAFGRRVELNVEIESQRLPVEDELFDVVLALEIIEHLPRDPMQLLVEANRALRMGGQLIVSTPNLISERALGLARRGQHPANYYFSNVQDPWIAIISNGLQICWVRPFGPQASTSMHSTPISRGGIRMQNCVTTSIDSGIRSIFGVTTSSRPPRR